MRTNQIFVAVLLTCCGASLTGHLTGQSTSPDWSWFFLGTGVGNGQLLVSPNGATPEIIVPCGATGFTFGSRYWIVMRHDPTANDYQQRFVSPVYPASDPIVKMLAGEVVSSPGPEIVVVTRGGTVEVWNQAVRGRVTAFATGLSAVRSACLGDVDSDGDLDIVVVSPNGLRAFDNAGQIIWQRTDIGGTDVVAGQFDTDPPIEIICTDGRVLDCGSQLIEQHWQNGYVGDLEAADIDGDGMLELIVGDPLGFVWAHDIDTLVPKFSRPTANVGSIAIGNIDADANLEIGVGTTQFAPVTAFDSVTLAQDFSVPNTDAGVTSLVFGDLDNDGQVEVAWGAGFASTGPDFLHIAGVPNQAIEWSSADLNGPMIGPEFGDVDGDGNVEMVVIGNRGVFAGQRVLFFDPTTFRQEFRSAPIPSSFTASGASDLSLADVDGDGDAEIVVSNGDCTVYDYVNGQLTILWQVRGSSFPGPTYRFADIVDLDGNGTLEVVAAGLFAHVFQYGATAELWRSFYLGGIVQQLEVAQTDADPGLEIFALSTDGNIYVFDGASRNAQVIVQDAGVDRSAFAFIPTNIPGYQLQFPGLVVGDEDGNVSFLINTGSDFVTSGPFPTGAGVIDGIQWIGGTSLFAFGKAGRLQINDILAPLWTSQDLGPGFGTRIRPDLVTFTLTTVGSLGVSHFQF